MLGVLTRPWNSSEATWAVGGAFALVLSGLVPWPDALAAVRKGNDVYMFLVGMMLLSELARRAGLFEQLAAVCVHHARGSAMRLFALVYGLGTLVTIFMSNDATAVVLTPAVLAVTRHAKARPLPYLLACALIANAASFVLPISNPANLVIFGDKLPPLSHWFGRFALPSAAAIAATFWVLARLHRSELSGCIANGSSPVPFSRAAVLAAAGIGVSAIVLLAASALGQPLGGPSLLCGVVLCGIVRAVERVPLRDVVAHVSWPVLLLVAGLFVMVEGLQRVGVLQSLASLLHSAMTHSADATALSAGVVVAFACNLLNNLPVGLVAGSVVGSDGVHPLLQSAVAIGVDLGPNLSVTGSLATILWLMALRREGEHVSAWQFLKVGMVAMPVALVAALGALMLKA